jgi:hypothetical protein
MNVMLEKVKTKTNFLKYSELHQVNHSNIKVNILNGKKLEPQHNNKTYDDTYFNCNTNIIKWNIC